MAQKTKTAANKLHRKEAKVSRAAARHRANPATRAVGLLAEIADQPQLIAVAATTAAAGLVARRPDLVRGGARMLAAHLAATALKTAIKHRVDRSRPGHEIDGHGQTLRRGRGTGDHQLNSFPSGHTAGAVAVALAVSRDVDGAAVPATLAAGAVGVAQPLTGSHHLSDVIVGGAIGWLSEAIVSAAFDRIEPVVERAWARHVTSPADARRS